MKQPFRLTTATAAMVSLVVMGICSIAYIVLFTDITPPKLIGLTKAGEVTIHPPDQVQVNKPFELTVDIDTRKQLVNVVGIYLRFNPNHLQILDFDTSQSFCQFYPEKKFDNSQGIVSLACGSPHPGVSGKNTLIKLTLQPLVTGTTNILIDPKSQLLLSNGKGTNILHEHQAISFNVQNTL